MKYLLLKICQIPELIYMSITGRKAERGKKKKTLSGKDSALTASLKNGNNSSMEQLPLCSAVEWDCRTETLSASAVLKNYIMV